MIILAALWIGLPASVAPREAPPPAYRCARAITPAQGFAWAAAVFRGVVEEAEPNQGPHPLEVTVRVLERWKGEVADTVRVHTLYFPNVSPRVPGQTIDSPDAYPFVVGTEYMIYANLREGRLIATTCNRTRPVAEAAEDLAALPALAAARRAPGAAPKPRER